MEEKIQLNLTILTLTLSHLTTPVTPLDEHIIADKLLSERDRITLLMVPSFELLQLSLFDPSWSHSQNIEPLTIFVTLNILIALG